MLNRCATVRLCALIDGPQLAGRSPAAAGPARSVIGIVRRHEEARPAIVEIIFLAAGPRGDHGQTAMHRLEVDETERLVQRRQREHVGCRQQLILGFVRHEAAELDPVADAQLLRLRLQAPAAPARRR